MTVIPPATVLKNAVFIRETSFSKIRSQSVNMQTIRCRGRTLIHLCSSYLDETSHGKMQGWSLDERVEQVVKSWNISETKVKQETCVLNLAQRLTCLETKPFPQPLLFYLNLLYAFV